MQSLCLPILCLALSAPAAAADGLALCGQVLPEDADEFECHDENVSDFSALAERPSLTKVDLADTGLRGLEPLAALPNLRRLWIDDTAVSDLQPIARLPLELLSIGGTRIDDLTPLAGMTSLRLLSFSGSLVTPGAVMKSSAPLAALVNLEYLMLGLVARFDPVHLRKLRKLKRIDALASNLTARHAAALRADHPDADIRWSADSSAAYIKAAAQPSSAQPAARSTKVLVDCDRILKPVEIQKACGGQRFKRLRVGAAEPMHIGPDLSCLRTFTDKRQRSVDLAIIHLVADDAARPLDVRPGQYDDEAPEVLARPKGLGDRALLSTYSRRGREGLAIDIRHAGLGVSLWIGQPQGNRQACSRRGLIELAKKIVGRLPKLAPR